MADKLKVLVPSYVDDDGVQVTSEIRSDGREYPDPVPVQPPIGYRAEPTIAELIKMFVRRELSEQAAAEDFETFEEAEDFDIEDDPADPLTPYEKVFDPAKPLIPDVKLEDVKKVAEAAVASPPPVVEAVPPEVKDSTSSS